jgi:hypothetical protein
LLAPIGTLTVTEVAEPEIITAFLPVENLTESRLLKPIPVITTLSKSTIPVFGEIPETAGNGVTVTPVAVLKPAQPEEPSTHSA